jgi:hypothetical protein
MRGTKTVFEADFIPPRLGSGLAPFADHTVAFSMELAAFQVAIASLKKFGKKRNQRMPISHSSYVWRRRTPRTSPIVIQVVPTGTQRTVNNTELRIFNAKIIDKSDPRVVYGKGSFGVAILADSKAKM